MRTFGYAGLGSCVDDAAAVYNRLHICFSPFLYSLSRPFFSNIFLPDFPLCFPPRKNGKTGGEGKKKTEIIPNFRNLTAEGKTSGILYVAFQYLDGGKNGN